MRVVCGVFLVSVAFLFNANAQVLQTQDRAECPHLEGEWSCNDQSSNSYELTITQILDSDVAKYEFTSDGRTSYYQADGIQYPYGVDGTQGTIQTACTTSSKINVFIRLSKPSFAEFNYTYTLKDPINLNGFATFYFEGQAPLKVKTDCVKIK